MTGGFAAAETDGIRHAGFQRSNGERWQIPGAARLVGGHFAHPRAGFAKGFSQQRASAALRDAIDSGRISSSEASRLSLIEGDATIRGVLPQDATLAYFSNLCFGEELTARIVERIIELPKLQCIGALRELLMPADREDVKCRLVQKRTIRVSTTWDENARLFIYCCE